MGNERPRHYFVYNPRHGPPKVCHGSRKKAEAEARRLAHAHPGNPFLVLGALSSFEVEDPVTVRRFTDGDNDPPF
jgi:hypothetical protein